ncbi:sigma-70 family RNA polymerase sigma factor [Planctomycetota bacterium]|nr:sigma-70 family RNA polymerase sigma factor [Planctomycetota bacterium]
MPLLESTFTHYQSTGDEQCFAEIVDQLYPLVTSVARRYCTNQNYVEDVVQDTLIRLARHAMTVDTNLQAWVSVTARNTAINYNRKAQSHRQRIERHATMPEHSIAWDSLYTRLDTALEQLCDEDRTLILAYYLNNQILSDIAAKRSCSTSTISRRLNTACKNLRNVFRDLQLNTLDEICTDTLFAEAVLNYTPATTFRTAEYQPNKPTINVGVYVSHLTTQATVTTHNFNKKVSTWHQLFNATFLKQCPNLRLIGLIEPGTIDQPQIESTLRERHYTGGYMDITNINDLKELDVIFLGTNFATSSLVLNSVYEAICSGVGLFSETRIGGKIPGFKSPSVQRLMMADHCVGSYHTRPCLQPTYTTTIHKPHPIIAGLKPGDELIVESCGTIFKPRSGAELLISKDKLVKPTRPCVDSPNPMKMPVLVSGNIGEGRSVLCNLTNIKPINDHPHMQGNFLANIINWLAEPCIKRKKTLLASM